MRRAASAALFSVLQEDRCDLFVWLMANIKKCEEKVKKGVDKWRMAWYSNQAVADEAGARV